MPQTKKEKIRAAREKVYTDSDAEVFDDMVENIDGEAEVQELIAEDREKYEGTRKTKDENDKKYPRKKDL